MSGDGMGDPSDENIFGVKDDPLSFLMPEPKVTAESLLQEFIDSTTSTEKGRSDLIRLRTKAKEFLGNQ